MRNAKVSAGQASAAACRSTPKLLIVSPGIGAPSISTSLAIQAVSHKTAWRSTLPINPNNPGRRRNYTASATAVGISKSATV